MEQRIREIIQDSDMVLVGIGEEFEGVRQLKQIPEYVRLIEEAEATGKDWMIPAINRYFADREIKKGQDAFAQIPNVLAGLAELLQDKNYFMVTVTTNDYVWDAGFKEGRVVAPCGGSRKKQCAGGKDCEVPPQPISQKEWEQLQGEISNGIDKIQESNICQMEYINNCPQCNRPMVLNNIFAENYDERGYLDTWQIYTKWLQGTLNRKLCILELGVGMQYPSVIRFPFEKIGYFNQKANFIRVNKNLYQLTEELKEKGISISENAVDWLTSLC